MDVGANVGFFSLVVATKTSSQVLAFEPVKYNREKINENVEINDIGNIGLFPYGLSNVNRKAEIYYSVHHRATAMTTLKSKYSDGSYTMQSELAQFKKLDGLEGLPEKIACVKMDIQGDELNALKGGKKTIQKHTPHLLIEIHPERLEKQSQSVRELFLFLLSCGYQSALDISNGNGITVDSFSRENTTFNPGRTMFYFEPE